MNNLAKYRGNKKLSQRQFAQKINVTGAAVGMWETGVRRPRLEKAREIALFFDVSIEDVFFNQFAHDTLSRKDYDLSIDEK